jgi:DNA mismatch endonuclease, patch repair protein
MDTVSVERRSQIMGRIRSKDTSPEMQVRRYLHGKGLRFRLHAKKLPGRPDLVFPRHGVALMVHGCFWHGCPNCIDGTRKVRSNVDYWRQKIDRNRQRDAQSAQMLSELGWRVLTIWECEVRDVARLRKLAARITRSNRLADHMKMKRSVEAQARLRARSRSILA